MKTRMNRRRRNFCINSNYVPSIYMDIPTTVNANDWGDRRENLTVLTM
jgi:hypothetical protein